VVLPKKAISMSSLDLANTSIYIYVYVYIYTHKKNGIIYSPEYGTAKKSHLQKQSNHGKNIMCIYVCVYVRKLQKNGNM